MIRLLQYNLLRWNRLIARAVYNVPYWRPFLATYYKVSLHLLQIFQYVLLNRIVFLRDYLPSFHNELKVNVWDLFFGIWNLSFGICPAESRDHRTHIILQFLGLPGRDSIMIHEHRKDKLLSVLARYIPG